MCVSVLFCDRTGVDAIGSLDLPARETAPDEEIPVAHGMREEAKDQASEAIARLLQADLERIQASYDLY